MIAFILIFHKNKIPDIQLHNDHHFEFLDLEGESKRIADSSGDFAVSAKTLKRPSNAWTFRSFERSNGDWLSVQKFVKQVLLVCAISLCY